MRFLVSAMIGLVALGTATARAADRPELTVYTYSSFTAEWGPGPAIKKAFEAECGCTLTFVEAEDGVAMLSRLRLEGKGTPADVAVGLDSSLLATAAETGLFAPHGLDLTGLDLPMAWTDSTFVPFDYGYFAFVYDKTKLANPPKSLAELVDGGDDWKVLIEDPRSSTPGLGLLLWVRSVYGDQAPEAWAKLKPRIQTVTKGWSEAYGLFLKGEAPLVLSYTTSPAYHAIAESDDHYAAAGFAEGHYIQVEVAAKLAGTSKPELADRFLAFLVSPAVQELIPTGNWMFPVKTPAGGLPPAFQTLVQPARTLSHAPAEVAARQKAWVQEWLAALAL